VGAGHPHHHRAAGGGGLIAAPEVFAGLDQGEGAACGHPQAVQGLAGEDLAHAALEGEAAVTAAAPGGGAAALGAQVLQLAVAVAQLAIEEAAAIAELGVVHPELVAVVAQGQQRRARLEAAVGGLHGAVSDGGRVQPQLPEQIVVAETQLGAGEVRRLHHVPEVGAQALDRRLEGKRQQGVGERRRGRGDAGHDRPPL
jgi:hypothetical protein